ncbi:hypothetical protein AGLY_014837 [Aphis glycines]|uniref:Integrase catalytic domain-containing protein n=1 Tax=Aphis glycines TaxID=307491 RepID=A0A6G0T4F8_APHGL|nr:hypothetical protein AGLY_014837 [Aphis glycines]
MNNSQEIREFLDSSFLSSTSSYNQGQLMNSTQTSNETIDIIPLSTNISVLHQKKLLNIWEKIIYFIQLDKIYGPTSLSNLNSANQITTFNIKEENSFLSIKKSKYQLSGRVLQADGTNYTKGSNIILVDNFVAFLFTRIEVKKNGKIIDTIYNVGRCSLIKGGGYFSAVGKLSNLCLGFFKDIQYPVYKGGFEISFLRHSDDDALFREQNDKNELPSAGKIIIDEFNIRIPYVVYDDMNKIKLINELTSLSQRNEYMFIFKSWQCIEDRNITGKTLTKDIINMYRNVHNPLFAIVAFQTDKLDNQLRDPIQFNNCNLKNIWLDIDSMRYPEELLNLDFKNEKFNIAYDIPKAKTDDPSYSLRNKHNANKAEDNYKTLYKINDGFKYILNVIDTFSKYVWSVPLKTKTGLEVANAFSQIFKYDIPKNLHVDKGTDKKASIIERFNRTLGDKLKKVLYLNNVWISELPKIIKTYNNTHHKTIKMKPADVKFLELKLK